MIQEAGPAERSVRWAFFGLPQSGAKLGDKTMHCTLLFPLILKLHLPSPAKFIFSPEKFSGKTGCFFLSHGRGRSF